MSATGEGPLSISSTKAPQLPSEAASDKSLPGWKRFLVRLPGGPWFAGWSALVALATLALYVKLWRWAMMGADDYGNTTRHRQAHGQTTWEWFWADWLKDYTEINGRAADVWARMIFATGPSTWRLIPPVIAALTVLAWACWLHSALHPVLHSAHPATRESALRSRTGRIAARLLVPLSLGALAGVPFAVAAAYPHTAVDASFTVSAMTGYVLSVTFLVVGSLPYVAALRGEELKTGMKVLGTVGVVGAAITHEGPSVAMAGVSLFCVALLGREVLRHRHLIWCTVLALAGLAAIVLSPGVQSRRTLVESSDPDFNAIDRQLLGAVNFLTQLFISGSWMWIVAGLAATAVAAVAVGGVRSRLRWPHLVAAVALPLIGYRLATMSEAWVYVARVNRAQPQYPLPTAAQITQGRLFLLLFLVMVLLLVAVLVPLRHQLGVAPLLAAGTAWGCLALPMAVGLPTPARVPTPFLLLWVAYTVLVLAVIGRVGIEALDRVESPKLRILGAATVLATVTALTLTGYTAYNGLTTTARGMSRNHKLWAQDEAALIAARGRGGPDCSVVLHSRYPAPIQHYRLAYGHHSLSEAMLLYYGVDNCRSEWK